MQGVTSHHSPPFVASILCAASACQPTVSTGKEPAQLPHTPAPAAMPKPQGPELRKYMDKRISVKLNGKREVNGVLRGYDQFMNIVVEAGEEAGSGAAVGTAVIRGNSIIQIECLDKVW